MRLSIKQKQVIGVTLIVALIVIALSLLQLINTAGVLLAESRDRFELFGSAVYTQAASAITSPQTAYNDVRTSRYVQSALQSALYSQDTVDAFIVDPSGVACSQRSCLTFNSPVSTLSSNLTKAPSSRFTLHVNGICVSARVATSILWMRPSINVKMDLPSAEMVPM